LFVGVRAEVCGYVSIKTTLKMEKFRAVYLRRRIAEARANAPAGYVDSTILSSRVSDPTVNYGLPNYSVGRNTMDISTILLP
jgi:hypothetical protein